MPTRTNVADRLAKVAAQRPRQLAAVSMASGATCTFAELDADASGLARRLVDMGVTPGTRLVLLVPPGVEFVKLVFALLRSGATTVLVDPGMGAKHLLNCLAAAEPEGFIAVSRAQAVRVVKRRRFPKAKLNVTVGRRWFWGGPTYAQLLERGRASCAELPTTAADDPAAIIFTSGSTGPPKGVLYTHRMFETQVAEIQRAYDIQPGGVDLSCFALFGLFNSAWGVTTVFPEMDFSRPAAADPRKLLAAANEWKITQAFASPAVWDKLSRHGKATGERIPTLRQVFSCGAPVPAAVLQRTLAIVHPDARMHTPYGATECLPVSTIEAAEVLNETAAKTAEGAGVCVGRKFDSIDWRVIPITDEPIENLDEAEELPPGEIGELIVRGPQVSPAYMISPAPSPLRGGLGRGTAPGTRPNHPSLTLPIEGREPEDSEMPNDEARMRNDECRTTPSFVIPHSSFNHSPRWHRTGDVGYLDDQQRFWYCGRKSQRVETAAGPLYTEQVEAIFNQHPAIRRAALVGRGERGSQVPSIVAEPHDSQLAVPGKAYLQLCDELIALAFGYEMTESISGVVLVDSMPVDVRHNSKINREQLQNVVADAIHFDREIDFSQQSGKWIIQGTGAPPNSNLATEPIKTPADHVIETLDRRPTFDS